MERKTKILIAVIFLIIIILSFIICFMLNPKPIKDIKLTEDKLITNQTLIDLILIKKVSPLGNNLTTLVLRDDYKDKHIFDGFSEVAYYVCIENEHRGWIYYSGGIAGIQKLYGPYEWCLI